MVVVVVVVVVVVKMVCGVCVWWCVWGGILPYSAVDFATTPLTARLWLCTHLSVQWRALGGPKSGKEVSVWTSVLLWLQMAAVAAGHGFPLVQIVHLSHALGRRARSGQSNA